MTIYLLALFTTLFLTNLYNAIFCKEKECNKFLIRGIFWAINVLIVLINR